MDPDLKGIGEELGGELVFRLYYIILYSNYINYRLTKEYMFNKQKKILKSCHYNAYIKFGQLY